MEVRRILYSQSTPQCQQLILDFQHLQQQPQIRTSENLTHSCYWSKTTLSFNWQLRRNLWQLRGVMPSEYYLGLILSLSRAKNFSNLWKLCKMKIISSYGLNLHKTRQTNWNLRVWNHKRHKWDRLMLCLLVLVWMGELLMLGDWLLSLLNGFGFQRMLNRGSFLLSSVENWIFRK